MTASLLEILTLASPLLFATLGALCSEYAGVLAVFMDGAITFSGFICIAVTAAGGGPLLAFTTSAASTIVLLFAVARFTERTKANPFLTGLAVNFFVSGATSWLSQAFYGTRGVIALSSFGIEVNFPRHLIFPVALAVTVIFALLLHSTHFALNLKITGTSASVLSSRGVSPGRYRTISWCLAAFFAACAGCTLTLDLGAFVPNVSAGRGWTALAAVYLGYKNPLLCVGAVLLFAVTEYLTTVLQGFGNVPSTLILGLPYALALLVFVLIPQKK